MSVADRIQNVRDRWERLSQRERTLVGLFIVSFFLTTTFIFSFLIADGLSELGDKNAAMRQALKDLESQREPYLRQKAKVSQLESRIGRTPVQLQGYLESAAKEAGVEIPESNERPVPQPSGGKWAERSVNLHLRKVTLEALTKFMQRVETGAGFVVVTALNVRARDDKHQEFDVEMSVSTYEHASDKKDKPGAKKDKEKDQDKDKG